MRVLDFIFTRIIGVKCVRKISEPSCGFKEKNIIFKEMFLWNTDVKCVDAKWILEKHFALSATKK